MNKRVAILGCGPAGLLATHAARLMGHEVTVFSRLQKSPMLGAQFLHKPIKGLPLSPPQKLTYTLYGSVEGYRQKVYGNSEDDITVSPESFNGVHEAWSLREAYNILWAKLSSLVVDCNIDSALISQIVQVYDQVISTIPAPTLCYQPEVHQFRATKVLINNQWSGPELNTPQNIVICNGYETADWYRTSMIYGHANTEWPLDLGFMSRSNAVAVRKPIVTNCDCWPNIIRAGRYGAWKKGVLSHEAFDLMLEVL